jgi:hypothetical protein
MLVSRTFGAFTADMVVADSQFPEVNPDGGGVGSECLRYVG